MIWGTAVEKCLYHSPSGVWVQELGESSCSQVCRESSRSHLYPLGTRHTKPRLSWEPCSVFSCQHRVLQLWFIRGRKLKLPWYRSLLCDVCNCSAYHWKVKKKILNILKLRSKLTHLYRKAVQLHVVLHHCMAFLAVNFIPLQVLAVSTWPKRCCSSD